MVAQHPAWLPCFLWVTHSSPFHLRMPPGFFFFSSAVHAEILSGTFFSLFFEVYTSTFELLRISFLPSSDLSVVEKDCSHRKEEAKLSVFIQFSFLFRLHFQDCSRDAVY